MTTRPSAAHAVTHTVTYTASSTSARAGFMSLAAVVTFAVLASLSHVANREVDDVLTARGGSLPMAQATKASEAMRKQS